MPAKVRTTKTEHLNNKVMDALNLTFFTENISPSPVWNAHRATFYNNAVVLTSTDRYTNIGCYDVEGLRVTTAENGTLSIGFSKDGNFVQFTIAPAQ